MPETTQPLSAELAAFNAAIALANILLPRVLDAMKKGEVPVEQQQTVRNNYEALRAAGAQAFTGPEWEVTSRHN